MLEEMLRRYDARADGFEFSDLSGEVGAIASQERASAAGVPLAVQAEQLAFDLQPHYGPDKSGWDTCYGPLMSGGGREYPAQSAITADMVAYWAGRARQAAHPLLRLRYADLAWDFWRKARADKCPPDLPRVMIDAAVEVARRGVTAHKTEPIRQLQRALGVAIGIKATQEQLGRVRNAILAYEDAVAVDHLAGLWGFSFDLLINNKKAGVTEYQAGKIVADLEARLDRLSALPDERLDPHDVQHAAVRLADHYRRLQRLDDMRRVLRLYARAFLRKAAAGPQMTASAWLLGVHKTLVRYGLNGDAKAILPYYSEAGRRAVGEMGRHEVSVDVPRDELDAYLESQTSGSWDEVFGRITRQCVLWREAEMQRLREVHGTTDLLNLFGTTLVDRGGRTVARIGPLDDDPEGNLVHHMGRMMGCGAVFLRAVMQRLIDTRGLDWSVIEAQIRPCPVFTDGDWPVLERAVGAYLAEDWIVAVHLLIPRLEAAVRALVSSQGGDYLKESKSGGMQYRTLDDLLRDDTLEKCLPQDVRFYLRTLLTDQRGWNLRNDVCHGIDPVQGFTAATADRLFHALLVIGRLRLKGEPQLPSQEPESTK